ncbi:MAG: FUSC family protein [Sarcina sp.]
MINLKDYLKNKSGINFYNMFKYGSIACLSMLIIVLFFGTENIMLAFPIALIGIALSLENIRIHTFKKVFSIIFLNSLLILISHFACKHLYIGIFINFLTIFTIAFFLTFSYNLKIYKPFLMLFVFTSFSHDDLYGVFQKILASSIGVILVVSITLLLDFKKSKHTLLYEFDAPFKNLLHLIQSAIDSDFDLITFDKTIQSLRKVTYDIYINRNNKALTTYKDKLKIDLYLHLSYICNFLYKEFYKNKFKNTDDLKVMLNSFILTFNNFNSDDISKILTNLNAFCYNTTFAKQKNINEFISIIKNLTNTINEYNITSNRKLNSNYLNYKKSKFDRYSYLLEGHFFTSVRTNFAMRISLTLTACLFFSHLVSFSKTIWVSITIMSVMQIYYEDTISKEKERIKGNLIGISIFIIISFIHIQILSIIVLVISLYFTYAFKEYYKLSIFTSLASLSVTSIYTHIHEAALYRVALIALGILIVFAANKFLFKTTIEQGMNSLVSQILFYNDKFAKLIISNNPNSKKYIPEILILTSLTTEKLYNRNKIIKNKRINRLIIQNNLSMIKLAYLELIK